MNLIELAKYFRLEYRTISLLLKKDWKDIPYTTNGYNNSGKRYKFNLDEVMNFIENKFNDNRI